jgi:ABC-type dipeptide/oligopeptide/nickel transport system permease component
MRLLQQLLRHPEFFFWVIIAIMFFILWRKNEGINKMVTEIRKKSIGGIFRTESGEAVFQREAGQAVEMLNDAFYKTSRLSGLGFILSSLGAVFSGIFSLMRN